MLITQKKQYALRAIFELAKRMGEGPVKSSEVADSQAIPARFLEVILSQLKRKGLVASKRGFYGGYTLSRSPGQLTVGDVFRLLEDEDSQGDCVACKHKRDCPFFGDCVFLDMWDEVHSAMYRIYDRTTIRHLMESENARFSKPA